MSDEDGSYGEGPESEWRETEGDHASATDICSEAEYEFDVEDFLALSDDDADDAEKVRAAGFIGDMAPTPAERRILLGREFQDWDKFKDALHDYKATSGCVLRRLKTCQSHVRAVCRGWDKESENGCKVELTARRLVQTGKITIRKIYLVHTCPTGIHNWRNGSHRKAWVAKKLQQHVQINPKAPLKELNANLRSFHSATSVTWTLQRARALCKENMVGGFKECFQKIPSYISAIRKADPSAHAYFQTGEERRFARLFVSPSSSQNIFKHCRPLVGLDGTHTTSKHPMTILFATCFDGENHIVVLAWAIVRVENGDNWAWFTEHLRQAFPTMKSSNTVFISDRDKGLKRALAESFPDQYAAHCVQHLRANVKGKFDVHCSNYFKQVVAARTQSEFESLLSSFQPQSDRQVKFVEYVRQIDPVLYARHAFPVPRWGHTTSNVVEIINGAVKPCRELPALKISDFMWNYCMEHHYKRQQHARGLPTNLLALTEYANNLKGRLYRESRSVQERQASDSESLMIDASGSWAVNIANRYCECGDWVDMDFPCVHAIRFLSNRGLDCAEYVGQVWLAENQVRAYDVRVPPLSIDRLETSVDYCYEPIFKTKKNKKRSAKRHPGWAEQMARNNERQVRKQVQKCRVCGLSGHNARTCLMNIPSAVVSPAPTARRAGKSLMSEQQNSSQTLRVGGENTATREDDRSEWQIWETRSSTLNYSEWFESENGPGNVTQE